MMDEPILSLSTVIFCFILFLANGCEYVSLLNFEILDRVVQDQYTSYIHKVENRPQVYIFAYIYIFKILNCDNFQSLYCTIKIYLIYLSEQNMVTSFSVNGNPFLTGHCDK